VSKKSNASVPLVIGKLNKQGKDVTVAEAEPPNHHTRIIRITI